MVVQATVELPTNRKVFAVGAVMAAEWLEGKKGFFEMKDILFDIK